MEERSRTIVGGRSAGFRNPSGYPRGIEVLLKKAKVDSEFRGLFLEDPIAAAEAIDLTLGDSERRILAGTVQSMLRTMLDRVFVPKHHVATFLTRNVAAMLALVLAATTPVVASWASEGITGEERLQRYESVAIERMEMIQIALEAYRRDRGSYPTTEQWITGDNPLLDYVGATNLYDLWNRKFHYQAVTKNTAIVGYCLESRGADFLHPGDNIPSPFAPGEHRFPAPRPLRLRQPEPAGGSPIVFEATHEDAEERVEWYLDETRVGRTVGTHKLTLDPAGLTPGEHLLLVVDDSGHDAVTVFVIESGSGSGPQGEIRIQ